MLKIKELSLVQKAGLVIWSVSIAGFMTYCIKETKKEIDEIKALNDMIADDAQRLKEGL